MIAACPNCKTKFRIARERLGTAGVRLRCTQCSSVFRVKAPESAPPAPAQEAPVEVPAPVSAPPESDTDASFDSTRLVVVAHSDAALAKSTVEELESWGLQALAVHDGVEAILSIQRHMPRAVVLDAALPKMYGFQLCELIKRNESLRSIQVMLVGAIHDDARYRRTPGQLYGADVYLEAPDLPDGLHAPLAAVGLPLSGAAPSAQSPTANTHRGIGGIDAEAALEAAEPPEEAPPPPVPEPPVAAPSATPGPALTPAAAAADDAVAQAERLARIIVSDVILYNEEKFAAAVARGSVIESMEPDLQEGRSLFQARIDPAVAGLRDFLREELLRVAKQRGTS